MVREALIASLSITLHDRSLRIQDPAEHVIKVKKSTEDVLKELNNVYGKYKVYPRYLHERLQRAHVSIAAYAHVHWNITCVRERVKLFVFMCMISPYNMHLPTPTQKVHGEPSATAEKSSPSENPGTFALMCSFIARSDIVTLPRTPIPCARCVVRI